MNVYEKLMETQSKLKAPKNQFNSFGKYNYRSCEDILEGLKPILKEVKAIVTLQDEIVQVENRIYVKATATFTDVEKGNKVEVSALAREDEEKKGMDLAQITGSVSSYARKYALNGLFCIDDTKDSDATNEHGKGNKNQNKPQSDKPSNPQTSLTENQIKRLLAIANKAGYDVNKVKAAALKKYQVTDLLNLTKEQYDTMCNAYESAQKGN